MPNRSRSPQEVGAIPVLGALFAVTLTILMWAGDWAGALGAIVAFSAASVVLHFIDARTDDELRAHRRAAPADP